jgi:single-strand DNA-binding protein
MNKVFIIGRLVRDVESKQAGETTVARITVAVDRRFKKDGQAEADFIPCVAFGKTAEFLSKYFSKGSKIVIEGRWQTGSYTNKEGAKVYTHDCVIDGVEFGESKKEAASAPAGADDFMSTNTDIDDEMPFGQELPT